ncbi:MAG: translation initiation factor IF-2 [Chloroflexi bacterium]|nr:translation initiation factor IF-2 [Chloroflexota bacterium]
MSADAANEQAATGTAQASKQAVIPAALAVRELGDLLNVSPIEVIKELMKNGVMAAINQSIDYETAAAVAQQLGFQPQPREEQAAAAKEAVEEEEDPKKLQLRPPVVTVMGHVDHGKTSLLDAIRQTNVTAGEVGGITQHIGAYQVEVSAEGKPTAGGHKITFIDTPGHEAFTAMRARGAKVTDIAVLVVAADDGVMPQTVEAIDHAKAASVPIIVAINKVDLTDANAERVKQQLTEHNLLIEEWGGDVIAIPVSAKTAEGIPDLLEHIILVSEISELKANPDRPAAGSVVEAELDASRGPMATVLVQTGTLHVGDAIVVGDTWGKIKAMFNDRGQRVREAGPSVPVKIMGLEDVPRAGDAITALKDEKSARTVMEERERQQALARTGGRAVTLEAVSGEIAAGKVKELNVVIKADVQGSIEAIRTAVERLSSKNVKVKVIHTGTGNVSESDVMLALASQGIIIGFHVRTDPGARRLAEAETVDIRHYEIIYKLTEDLEKAVQGLLEPEVVEVVDGHAEVRAIFKVRGGRVAGCYLLDGSVSRNSLCRVQRGGEVLHTSRVASLRRFQEDVREVQTGYECGIGVEGFDDFQESDVIEAFHQESRMPGTDAASPAPAKKAPVRRRRAPKT